VAEIFGRQAADGLLPIDCAESGLRLRGLIGRPGIGRSTRHDLVAFVNTRPVDSRTLSGALIESYRESLPQGRYPVAFVFLDCAPADIDVNVHPAKREVRFRSEALVRGFVLRSVLNRLREFSSPSPPRGTAGAGPIEIGPPAALPAPFHASVGEPAHPPLLEATGSPAAPARPLGPAWRFLGTAHGSYALFETSQGLVLLDRRAAQERVWFERLRDQYNSEGVPVQRLLLTLTIELNPVESALLKDHLAFLGGHGLEVAEFGRNFFRVEALPAWMEPGDAEGFIRDLMGALREGQMPLSNLELARDQFARLAASKAVRLHLASSENDAQALLRDLFSTSVPLSSPSGHPTYVELNHGELARRFQK
jgi:DNA mismatch repair protein MutL